MGSMCGTNTTTSTNTPNPATSAQFTNLMNQANTVAGTPYQAYQGPLVAGLNTNQNTGISTLMNSGNVGDGMLYQANNYTNAAASTAAAGPNSSAFENPYAAQAANFGLGAFAQGPQAQQFNSQNVGQYMSPFTQNVIDSTMANINQNNAVQQTQLTGSAIQSGNAFGGDRAGVAAAELARNQDMASNATVAGLENQNYSQALGQFNTNNSQAQAGAQLGLAGLNAGQQGYAQAQQFGLGQEQFQSSAEAQAAAQSAGLGSTMFSNNIQAGQAELGAGTTQQQTQQNQLNSAYQQFQMAQAYPFATTQWNANIDAGLGGALGGTTTTTAPPPSMLSQVGGLGLAGVGLLGSGGLSSIGAGIGAGASSIGSGLASLAPLMLSDRRAKENLEPVGKSFDGQTIYRFNYKGENTTQLGFVAQEVERRHPDAVAQSGGLKFVDYDAATDSSAHRGHFSRGGLVPRYDDGGGVAGGLMPYQMSAPGMAATFPYMSSPIVPNSSIAHAHTNFPQGGMQANPATAAMNTFVSQAGTVSKALRDDRKGLGGAGAPLSLSASDYQEPSAGNSNLSSMTDAGLGGLYSRGGLVPRFADGGLADDDEELVPDAGLAPSPPRKPLRLTVGRMFDGPNGTPDGGDRTNADAMADYLRQQGPAPPDPGFTHEAEQPNPARPYLEGVGRIGQHFVDAAMAGPKLMGDVYSGEVDPMSEEGVGRATDVALGTLTGGMTGAEMHAASVARNAIIPDVVRRTAVGAGGAGLASAALLAPSNDAAEAGGDTPFTFIADPGERAARDAAWKGAVEYRKNAAGRDLRDKAGHPIIDEAATAQKRGEYVRQVTQEFASRAAAEREGQGRAAAAENERRLNAASASERLNAFQDANADRIAEYKEKNPARLAEYNAALGATPDETILMKRNVLQGHAQEDQAAARRKAEEDQPLVKRYPWAGYALEGAAIGLGGLGPATSMLSRASALRRLAIDSEEAIRRGAPASERMILQNRLEAAKGLSPVNWKEGAAMLAAPPLMNTGIPMVVDGVTKGFNSKAFNEDWNESMPYTNGGWSEAGLKRTGLNLLEGFGTPAVSYGLASGVLGPMFGRDFDAVKGRAGAALKSLDEFKGLQAAAEAAEERRIANEAKRMTEEANAKKLSERSQRGAATRKSNLEAKARAEAAANAPPVAAPVVTPAKNKAIRKAAQDAAEALPAQEPVLPLTKPRAPRKRPGGSPPGPTLNSPMARGGGVPGFADGGAPSFDEEWGDLPLATYQGSGVPASGEMASPSMGFDGAPASGQVGLMPRGLDFDASPFRPESSARRARISSAADPGPMAGADNLAYTVSPGLQNTMPAAGLYPGDDADTTGSAPQGLGAIERRPLPPADDSADYMPASQGHDDPISFLKDKLGGIFHRRQSPDDGTGPGKPDPWLALASAGFGMMSGTSPFPLVNIGQGGLAGLKNYGDQQKELREEFDAKQRGQHMMEQTELARKKLAQDEQDRRDRLRESQRQHAATEQDRRDRADYNKQLLEQGKMPVGYRRTDDGNLEFIPKGPADPATIAAVEKVKHPVADVDSVIDQNTLKRTASMYNIAGSSVLTNLGRGAQGSSVIMAIKKEAARQDEEAGISPQMRTTMQAEYGGLKAGERTAGTASATTSRAAFEARNMIPQAIEASEKVPRTNWVPVNKLIEGWQSGVYSDPAQADFAAANFSLVNTYVRAIAPTGVPPDSVRKHAYDMLGGAMGHDAYRAVINRMDKEMEAAEKSPAQVVQMFRNLYGKGDGLGGTSGVASPAVPPAAAKPSGTPVRVDSPADAWALAPGTRYFLPDGSVKSR